MKLKKFVGFPVLFLVALFSYTMSNAQVVDKVKDAASATKDATVKAAKKTADVTKDAASATKDVTVNTYDAAAEMIKKGTDSTVKTVRVGSSKVNKYGDYSINVTEGVAGQAYEGGKWLMTTAWDGTKWVSKREWFPNPKRTAAPNPQQ